MRNKNHVKLIARVVLCLVIGIFVAFAGKEVFAHGSGGDLAVFSTGNKVDVGFALLDDDDINQVFFDPNDSVFQAVLAPLAPFIPFDLGAPEPGWDANEGELPPSSTITPMVMSLQYWNGTGPVSFAPAAGVSGGFYEPTFVANNQGGFHKHFIFGLADLTADALPDPRRRLPGQTQGERNRPGRLGPVLRGGAGRPADHGCC